MKSSEVVVSRLRPGEKCVVHVGLRINSWLRRWQVGRTRCECLLICAFVLTCCVLKLRSVVDGEDRHQTALGRGQRYARLYLKPWYSPTDSYLQIHSPDGAVECRSRLVLDVSYTSRTHSPANPFTFVYQVLLPS